MYYIKTKPLLDGMVPCLKCENHGNRAYTELVTYCLYDGPDIYAISHWCDTGGLDSEWNEAKNTVMAM